MKLKSRKQQPHHRLAALLTSLTLLLLTAAPSSTLAAETITYYHLDALGSPVAASDEQGNLKWREDYKPYGEKIRNEPASTSNSRAYTGHPHDNETGLTYAGARYYDPVVGRFMGVDPVSFTEKNIHSFNRYGYGNNNPYKYIDPDGKDTISVDATIRVPSWVGKIIFGDEFIGQGGAISVGLSYPGFTGGDLDLGVLVEGHAGGGDIGVGRGSVGLTYSGGSVSDLGGTGTQMDFTWKAAGVHLSLDDKDNFSGAGFHIGPGYNVGISGTIGETYTARDFVFWALDKLSNNSAE